MSLGVSVGDIVVLSGLAWRVYKSCKESSDDFRRLSNDLASLDATLRETVEFLQENGDHLDTSRRHRLCIIYEGCTSTLQDLDSLVQRYESLGTNAQRTWDRMRFGLTELSDVRSRLVSNTTMLNAFTSMMINSSIARLEKRMKKLLTETRAGLREGSIVTATDVAETIESPSVWAELRRELEDVGISAAIVEENREYIISWMKQALGEGGTMPSEDETATLGDIDGASILEGGSVKMLPPSIAPSDSGYGRAAPSFHRPSVVALTAANTQFEEDLRVRRIGRPVEEILQYMSAAEMAPPPLQPLMPASTALSSVSTTTIKRRKADPGRLLLKLFQKETAIIQAASDNDIEKVARLLRLGVNVNARDRWGWSALSMCGYGGHKAVARLLLDHGADLDNIDVDGDTPSSLAAQRGHSDLVIMFDEERALRDLQLREADTEVARKVDI